MSTRTVRKRRPLTISAMRSRSRAFLDWLLDNMNRLRDVRMLLGRVSQEANHCQGATPGQLRELAGRLQWCALQIEEMERTTPAM